MTYNKTNYYKAKAKSKAYATTSMAKIDTKPLNHEVTLHNENRFKITLKGVLTLTLEKRLAMLYGHTRMGNDIYVNATATNYHILDQLKFKLDKQISLLINKDYKNKFKSIEGMTAEPYPYQCDGISFLESRKGRALLASDMGVGKTLQAIGYIHKNKQFPAFIVCPSTLKLNWRNEIIKWCGKDQDISVIDGKSIVIGKLSPQWNILNYDIIAAWNSSLKQHAKNMGYGCMVLDECHKIKNESTLRTKACLNLAKHMNSIVCISGTPIDNRPAEFFSTLKMLAPGLFATKYEFGLKFCAGHQSLYGFDMTGASNTKELYDLLSKTIMIRHKKSEVLKDLPKNRNIIIPLEMTKAQAKQYQTSKDDFVLKLKESDAKTKQGLALVQIGVLKKHVASFKLDSVCDWIDDFLETGQKLVLFMVHRDIQGIFVDRYKDACVSINGLTKVEDRQKAMDSFQSDPKTKLFIATIKTGGVGITLTAASTVAFVEFGWTVSEHDQCSDRVLRIGQTSSRVDSYYFVMQDTIEDSIMDILDRKRKILDNVLDGVDSDSGNIFKDLMKEFTSTDAD